VLLNVAGRSEPPGGVTGPTRTDRLPRRIKQGRAWVATAKRLVSLGADPTVTDAQHDASPRRWAAHGARDELVPWFDARSRRPDGAARGVRLLTYHPDGRLHVGASRSGVRRSLRVTLRRSILLRREVELGVPNQKVN
jgi:hypothetical protein